MNNKTSMDMAHVWKQTVLNRVTRTVDGVVEEKQIDRDGNPVSRCLLLKRFLYDVIFHLVHRTWSR